MGKEVNYSRSNLMVHIGEHFAIEQRVRQFQMKSNVVEIACGVGRELEVSPISIVCQKWRGAVISVS